MNRRRSSNAMEFDPGDDTDTGERRLERFPAPPDPDPLLGEDLRHVLARLAPRRRQALALYYGLEYGRNPGDPAPEVTVQSLVRVSKVMKCSKEFVRQCLRAAMEDALTLMSGADPRETIVKLLGSSPEPLSAPTIAERTHLTLKVVRSAIRRMSAERLIERVERPNRHVHKYGVYRLVAYGIGSTGTAS